MSGAPRTAKQRGTCDNRSNISETVAGKAIIAELVQALTSPSAIGEIRRLYAQHEAGEARDASGAQRARAKRLADVERKIAGLIMLQAEGDRSEYVVGARRELEAEAVTLRAAAAAEVDRPVVRLPSLAEIEKAMLEVAGLLTGGDRRAAREALRRLLGGKRIRVERDAAGVHRAYVELRPLAAVVAPERLKPRGEGLGASYASEHCGGQLDWGAYTSLITIDRVIEFRPGVRSP